MNPGCAACAETRFPEARANSSSLIIGGAVEEKESREVERERERGDENKPNQAQTNNAFMDRQVTNRGRSVCSFWDYVTQVTYQDEENQHPSNYKTFGTI
jgi:hypothetical protein